MFSQSPCFWWFLKVQNWFIWVHAEELAVMVAVTADLIGFHGNMFTELSLAMVISSGPIIPVSSRHVTLLSF
jgi:hypothetical protein